MAHRLSPVHAALGRLQPHWGDIAGMPAALDFREITIERSRASALALCDVSALPRITVKGPAAVEFVARLGLTVPAGVYGVDPLPDGGLVVRTGTSELFLESGPRGESVAGLAAALGRGGDGIYPVPRQDASFLLSGTRAPEVLAQTCAINFQETGVAFIMTRVAGVSAAILPRTLNGLPVYQLWLDYSYGPWLWDQLFAIVRELEGGVVGVACFLTP
jgi:sarcosine oxidase subunit gamma